VKTPGTLPGRRWSGEKEFLTVKKSGCLPRPVSAADLALMRRTDEMHLEHHFMDARMLRRQMDREGI